jgi:hypothetical protein
LWIGFSTSQQWSFVGFSLLEMGWVLVQQDVCVFYIISFKGFCTRIAALVHTLLYINYMALITELYAGVCLTRVAGNERWKDTAKKSTFI